MASEFWYLTTLSEIFGVVYFFAWSFSFYPQVVLNHQRKSVAGFSIQFAILNVQGFLFYTLYTTGGFVYPRLGTGAVQWQDVAFAVHAFLISSCQLAQVFIYERGQQRDFKTWVKYLIIIQWAVFLTVFILEGMYQTPEIPKSFNTFRVSGYNKAIITFLK